MDTLVASPVSLGAPHVQRIVGIPDVRISSAPTFCVEVIVTPGSFSGPLCWSEASIGAEYSCSHAPGSSMSSPASRDCVGVGSAVGEAVAEADAVALALADGPGTG